MNESINELKRLARTFPEVENLALAVIDLPEFAEWTASGSPKVHHYGDGQLAAHTLEVVKLSLVSNEALGSRVRPDLLFLAALYHDVGKIKDYRRGIDENGKPCWESTAYKKKVYHITTSALIWTENFRRVLPRLTEADYEEVLHAILSHHGRPEWKSLTPQTGMAWILHLSDCMSARVDETLPKPRVTKPFLDAEKLDAAYQAAFATLKPGEVCPPCPACGGVMKPWDAWLVTGASCTSCGWNMNEGSGCLA